MRKQLQVLIADNDDVFAPELGEVLQSQGYAVDLTGDGNQALEWLEDRSYDGLILDIALPGLDGLAVLSKLSLEKTPKYILAVSALANDFVITAANLCGAQFFLAKPCQPERVAECLGQMQRAAQSGILHNERKRSVERMTTCLLRQLGVPMHVKGYTYLKTAILLAQKDPSMLDAMISRLYTEVGVRCESSASRVERLIRMVVQSIWEDNTTQIPRRFLCGERYDPSNRPTNSELLCTIVQYLQELNETPEQSTF